MKTFCTNCDLEESLVEQGSASTFYSVDLGDHRRVLKVEMDGKDVTRICRSAIPGSGGKVQVYIEPIQVCQRCHEGHLSQILCGDVIVTLKEVITA